MAMPSFVTVPRQLCPDRKLLREKTKWTPEKNLIWNHLKLMDNFQVNHFKSRQWFWYPNVFPEIFLFQISWFYFVIRGRTSQRSKSRSREGHIVVVYGSGIYVAVYGWFASPEMRRVSPMLWNSYFMWNENSMKSFHWKEKFFLSYIFFEKFSFF